jgi:hypothetical protein
MLLINKNKNMSQNKSVKIIVGRTVDRVADFFCAHLKNLAAGYIIIKNITNKTKLIRDVQ